MVKKVKSGISGLDRMLDGGFPKGAVVMVSGSAGAGKTIFTLQILTEAAKTGEKCLYVTFEQGAQDVVEQALEFDWDIKKLISKNKIKIVRITYPKLTKNKNIADMDEHEVPRMLVDGVIKEIKDFKPTRLVIDSLSTISSS
ncbi:AAA family ATPase, partial [Candidatus Micrarchaeota archaeon]|nr:AAA family ATPase [Candidatus Micrarchaeota archaeon]